MNRQNCDYSYHRTLAAKLNPVESRQVTASQGTQVGGSLGKIPFLTTAEAQAGDPISAVYRTVYSIRILTPILRSRLPG